ncbi:dentin sialophosphoprotein-like [Colletes gigas]|uniref:dentin sialophosphoprotein-like n=1 Tax=Colletes gigas TaxID=935657 RepID=UPI001C9B5C80|nr:dentin sialophosphoprotein-like [Colletes gigas]
MALPETGFVIAPQIPRGLAPAVEGLAREILRHQPHDIYTFAAHHFEQLVKLREKERVVGVSKISDRVSYNGKNCIWTGRGNVDPRDSEYRSDRRLINFIEETAAKELRRPTKLSKRRKEATNRSGWSINETVKVIKRHDHENNAKKKKHGNTRMYEKTNEKEIHSHPEQCSPRSTKKLARCRFLRSSSAGDILAKSVNRQHKGRREKFCDCIADAANTSKTEIEYVADCKKLKRQKSADQIEWICSSGDSRRSQSLVNVGSRRNGSDAERGTRRNRLDRLEKLESAVVRNAGVVVEREARNSEMEEMFGADRKVSEDESSARRESTLETSVVLPSVVPRQSSSRYSRNGSRNDAYESIEQNDPNNFVLPPISSDATKPIKRENNLTLPALATATEIQRDSNIENEKPLEISDRNSAENEHGDGKDGGSIETETSDRDILEELEITRRSDSRGLEVDEIFKDSLNVTPDSIELPQRPDSLEHAEDEEFPESNELKKKLIEIEMVERSIENTLVSSVTVSSPMKHSSRSGSEETHNDAMNEAREDSVEEQRLVETPGNDNEGIEAETSEEKSDAAETLSSKDGDVDRSEVGGTSGNPSKDIDLTCYVLTEGSPCEIPESVTTVIISDKTLRDDDTVHEQDHETRREESDHDANPFGEYICPETYEYSRGMDAYNVEFLRDIKAADDKMAVGHDLGNIKEEEESEKEALDKFNTRSTMLSSDIVAVESDSLGETLEAGGNKNEVESITEASSSNLDRSSTDVESTSPRVTCTTDVHSGTFEGNSPRVEDAGGQNEQRETSSSIDVPGPYVPELNLDSLRDATISSIEDRSDSRNVENQSEKETDDDITLREGEKTLSMSDTPDSGKKAASDEDSSKSKLSTDHEVRVEENGTEDCLIELEDKCIGTVSENNGKDTPNVEEEIAKELIEILTLETPIPQEEVKTENNALDSINDSSRSNCTNRPTDDSNLAIELDPCVDETGSIDRPSTGTSSREKTNGDVCEKYEEEGGIDTKDVDEIVHVSVSPSVSLETAEDVATDRVDSLAEDQDPEVPTVSDLESKSLDAAARRIQYWARRFLVGKRRPRDIDRQQSQQDSTSPAEDPTATLSSTREYSEKQIEELAVSDDRGKSEDNEIPETPEKAENEEWLITEKKESETQQTDTISTSSNLRHTGEFHDSLPLPLFEVSKGQLSTKDMRMNNMRETRNPWFTLEPGASCFDSESPRAGVFFAFDFSNAFRPVETKPDDSKYYLNFPPCIVRVERSFDDATIKPVDSDDIREPLALDEPPKSLFIEEILDIDEEKQRASTDSCKTVIDFPSGDDETVHIDKNTNPCENLSPDSSAIESDKSLKDETNKKMENVEETQSPSTQN